MSRSRSSSGLRRGHGKSGNKSNKSLTRAIVPRAFVLPLAMPFS